MARRPHWILAAALDGHGLHPAAWRAVGAPDAAGLLDGGVALRHTLSAEAAGLTFATLDDAYALDGTTDADVRARVDAMLLAAKLGPLTSSIGLVPTVSTTHTEPFHVSKNVATLDWVSGGRGGWRLSVSTTQEVADLFGRTAPEPLPGLYAEAADSVEVSRRLWDSWEDDAIIRDRTTGRFIDREKVHYVDFVGERFSVRGPSIVPRSPQGQPIVVVDAVDAGSVLLAASSADVVFVDAPDPAAATTRRQIVLDAVAAAGRSPEDVSVLVHLDVVIGDDEADAVARLDHLDAMRAWARPDDRALHTGDATSLADVLASWADAVDGVHLRPAVHDVDLAAVTASVAPALAAAGLLPTAAPGATLRDRLALPRPANRYAAPR